MTDKELNKRADNKRLALVLARYLGLIVLVVSLLDVVMVYWKMPGNLESESVTLNAGLGLWIMLLVSIATVVIFSILTQRSPSLGTVFDHRV